MRSSGFFVALVASLVRAAPQGGNGSIDASSGNHYASRGEVMEDFWVNPADTDDPIDLVELEESKVTLPLDCKLARILDLKPKVDCHYAWEHWFDGDNYLSYVIRIDASGQKSAGWFQGIYDNIKGECGTAPDCFEKHSCFNNMFWNETTIYEYGTTVHGLEAAYRIDKWVPGDDQTTCIKTAIEKASCGVQLDFVNGGCYKKKGSFKVPYHIEM